MAEIGKLMSNQSYSASQMDDGSNVELNPKPKMAPETGDDSW